MDKDTFETSLGGQRPPQLPALRLFMVRREVKSGLEELLVYAHEISFTPHGALCFIEYRLIDGQTVGLMPRVFNQWTDVEEIRPTGLIH